MIPQVVKNWNIGNNYFVNGVLWSVDYSGELFFDGASVDSVGGPTGRINSKMPAPISGENVVAFRVYGDYAVNGIIAEIRAGAARYPTDATWKLTTADPGATWAEPDFDDSSWGAAEVWTGTPWLSFPEGTGAETLVPPGGTGQNFSGTWWMRYAFTAP